jgi:hypothetical protein
MRDIILIAPKSYGFNSIIEALPKQLHVIFDEAEGRLSVRRNESGHFVEFNIDNSVSEYYDSPDEMEKVASIEGGAQFFLVHFKDVDDLKFVIKAVANRSDVLIDNDFGLIESGRDFVRRCEKSPDWDWLSFTSNKS